MHSGFAADCMPPSDDDVLENHHYDSRVCLSH
jgi:hypothetical protein